MRAGTIRTLRASLLFVPLLLVLATAAPAHSQNWVDTTEQESRAALHYWTRQITGRPGQVRLEGDGRTFVYETAGDKWHVELAPKTAPTAARTSRSFIVPETKKRYDVRGVVKDRRSLLEVVVQNDGKRSVLPVPLWTADQLESEVYAPSITSWAFDGPNLWLGIGNYIGEGYAGLGTFVRIEMGSDKIEVVQPKELEYASVESVAVAGGMLWMGTYEFGEGFVAPAKGLVSWNPETRELRPFTRGASPLVGSVVTAVESIEGALWVATDEGACRITLPGEAWTCWRIVSTVSVREPVAVSGAPGGDARGTLAPGSYEVRWIVGEFLEVVTPDAVEGWIETAELETFVSDGFGVENYNFENIHGGFPPLDLRAAPRKFSQVVGQLVRGKLQRVEDAEAETEAEGWVRVRAHLGWIPHHNLRIEFAVEKTTP